MVPVAREAGDQERVDQRIGSRHLQALSVYERAATVFGREQFLAVWIEDRGDLGDAVDLQRKRGAEEGQGVRVIGRSVDGVKHPAGSWRDVLRAPELFSEDLMIGKPF